MKTRNVLLTVAALAVGMPLLAYSQTGLKPPLDYRADDAWKVIEGAALSNDGAWFAYTLRPEYGDVTLVVRNVATGAEVREPRGTEAAFTESDRYLVYSVAPPFAQSEAARRAHKKPDEYPKAGLGILTLASGVVVNVENVKSYALATHSAKWIAYLIATPSPSPSPSGNASVAASSAPSPSPVPENKKKAEGGTLVLRSLETGASVEIPDVTEYALSPDERYLAYATETRDGSGDGLYLRNIASGNVTAVASGQGRYTNLTFAHDTDEFAFLSDSATYAHAAPVPVLYAGDPQRGVRTIGAGSPGMPRGWAPNVNGNVAFSRDGSLLYLGVNVAPTPLPSGTPQPLAVDLWNWRDTRLQSEQKVEADHDRTFTYTGVVHLASWRYVQLATKAVPVVLTNDNVRTALGVAEQPYDLQKSWDSEHQDEYLISLADGSRRLVARDVDTFAPCTLSPAGNYALCYDENARYWYTVRASDGRRVALTKGLPFAFYDELDDHPAPPPPYGNVGWTTSDTRVLLLDRYDIWSFNPDSGAGTRITQGYGRAHELRFHYLSLDPQRHDIPSTGPIYLTALDDRTKDGGIYRLPSAAGGLPVRLVGGPYIYGSPYGEGFLAARHADAVAFTRESFREPPDYWIGTRNFARVQRLTDADPQIARYRWGTEHLIHYIADGRHLDGILYIPDGLDLHRKHPMLVYIYERFSDQLHQFYPPEPGTVVNLPRYVSHGYVVLVPDIAYTVGHPGRSALYAVNAAIDTVLSRGFVDPKRIGIAGHSWGAYEIAYIITQTNRFAAAEAGAAVANMTSAYGGIRWGSGWVREFQYEVTQSRIGATPWDRPDLYLENSPLFHIRNVHTPYLTIHNDADDAVPWYQGIEFFTALRRLHKEAYFFDFNGEFHGLRDPDNMKYWTVHLDEFFDHFLLGTPEPAWMLYGVPYLHRGQRDVRPLFGEKP